MFERRLPWIVFVCEEATMDKVCVKGDCHSYGPGTIEG